MNIQCCNDLAAAAAAQMRTHIHTKTQACKFADLVNEHSPYGILGLLQGLRDNDALASCEAVGFHHDGRPLLSNKRKGRLNISKPAIGRSGNIVLGTQVLEKHTFGRY